MAMERRKVINRDNIVEDLNIEKIREKLLRACEGLEVNMVELESNIDSIYEENITEPAFYGCKLHDLCTTFYYRC